MEAPNNSFASEFYARFKVFHELMAFKIREIMLVSSPYDAFIIEEDGSLASRIINEYRGLNLSMPPRVTRVSSPRDAIDWVKRKRFDLIITMPHLDEMDPSSLGAAVKEIHPRLPVILLAHNARDVFHHERKGLSANIDKVFVWSGNSDLLLAIVKNVEDGINVDADTQRAMVRVLVLVEDSPVYRSSFLPLIYKEIVKQTQNILETGLNEEHRLLLMRARPKILLAENYEQAMAICEKFHAYLFGVISDARFPRKEHLDPHAGAFFLSWLRKEIPDLPLLMLSSEPENRSVAEGIPSVFIDKNTANLHTELRDFFLNHLGFGDFIFRLPDGTEIDRADNLHTLKAKLPHIPDASLLYHADRNHFSNWIMSRSEIVLASKFREVHTRDFENADDLRRYIISNVQALLTWQQRGVVAQFRRHRFDAEIMDFVKLGGGSLGGKARGLAFMSALLQENAEIHEKYPNINIKIPKSLVISTEGFEDFVTRNRLRYLAEDRYTDEQVREAFLNAAMPEWLLDDLKAFLSQVNMPLSVRSSSRLEDAHFQPYAGLYETYMLPNNQPDGAVRFDQLIAAIKRVYASTYYEGPKAFSRSTANQHNEEAMAIIIQEVAGAEYGDYFYPTLAGVLQSHNFYPVSHMKPDDGIAHIALGMGKTVVEGEKSLRFSPKYPGIQPQFSSVDEILAHSQRYFYALKIRPRKREVDFDRHANLVKREIDDAEDEIPVRILASTYIPEEHRIRDSGVFDGPKIMTFASILKHKRFPLPEILTDFLELGRKALGCAVEIEFAVNLVADDRGAEKKDVFYFLQLRPMVSVKDTLDIQITDDDLRNAFCVSQQSLGNGKNDEIRDIVYVKPEVFDPGKTFAMAEEVGNINAVLLKEKRPYLLVGPGRWGSSDRWLGVPVQWRHISGVQAIVELRNENLRVDPSQGSHFFQNITSLGIFYITINQGSEDRFCGDWLDRLSPVHETPHLRHVRLPEPICVKVDGRNARCIMMRTSSSCVR